MTRNTTVTSNFLQQLGVLELMPGLAGAAAAAGPGSAARTTGGTRGRHAVCDAGDRAAHAR